MWRSELYATEVHEPLAPLKYVLPVYTAPIAGEALLSWLSRLAAMVGQSPLLFTRHAFGIDSLGRPEWWRRPTTDQRDRLLAVSGLTPRQLDRMTLQGWSTARNDETDTRFSPRRVTHPRQYARGVRTMFVCGECLAEDEIPYLRREWLIGWQAVCPRHRKVLMRGCPHCGWKLSSLWLRGKEPIDWHRCTRCQGALVLDGPRAIDAVITLQKAMVETKRRGAGVIPGLGLIQWELFTVIVDLVLRAVWAEANIDRREALFAMVAKDLSLLRVGRFRTNWKGNYGALALMSWILAEWPHQLRRVLEMLDTPSIDTLLGQLDELTEASKIRARTLMRDVLDHRPQTAGWRQWLSGLVADGMDFRALAQGAAEWRHIERFTALAMLSEGRSIRDTARVLQVSTNMIKRWIEVGSTYGVEAVLRRPLRITDLTNDQIGEIAAWLATMPRPSHWTGDTIRSEIAARFGLMITTHAALRLFVENHPRRPEWSKRSPVRNDGTGTR
ncbi:TniQ family protein [Rhizorhabdus dicambivorans]|uniref:TniQ domain-containing protein n=1 Tax=Rhizorhabdus dicambivorans TaxID=1850238 RepID=A0A2A4FNC6_9SPHN|nr:TniQ family protein [Rhizorhabdus dicambivorans]ATE65186.1 hypothetical protein CMV14_12845 [Rhizorhabdus dicambivorans]ATE67895.1 hypothetical protein CMV14_25575 [Rhizorhabdus dicambivorans]PCE40265.1 hypothetical protein COO09_21065 [Rhizorhabdus dicambivorans]